MALRELLLPWLTQPAEAAPLSADVIGGATYQGFIAGRGAVGGYVPTVATAAAAVNRLGQARTLTGSGGYLSAPAVAGNTPWTLLFYGVLRSAGASSIATYAELPGDTSYDRSLFITSAGAVAGYVYDGALKTAFAGAPAAGVPFLAAVVGTTSSLTAYLDGAPGTAVATSNAGYSAYSTPELVIGYGGGSGGGNGGSAGLASLVDLAYLLRIDRAMSAEQLRALGVAPWSVFEDQRIQVPRATASGSSYSVAATEAATSTEAAAAALVAGAARTEAATASEASNSAHTAGAAQTETATATEAAAATVVALAASSEAASAADSLASALVATAAQAEAATASEASSSSTSGSAYDSSATEAASAADALASVLVAGGALTEAATATESAGATLVMAAARTEAATASTTQSTGSAATVTPVAARILAIPAEPRVLAILAEPSVLAIPPQSTVLQVTP